MYGNLQKQNKQIAEIFMKNKRLIYILAPLVLLIWGLIFYKIFTHFGDDQNKTMVNPDQTNTNKKQLPRDTFTIIANYRDPFLGRNNQPALHSSQDHILNNQTGLSRKPTPAPEIIPEIKYCGIIANPKNKRKVGLLRMNNKELLVKEGDSYNELKIIRLFNDSVKIMYNKTKKTFKKNNIKN